jgi:3-deoxy-D-manno-octulosonic-acid transferase
MYWLYNSLLTLFAPLWAPVAFFKARKHKHPAYGAERRGVYGFKLPKGGRNVWIHAVSFGEVQATIPLLKALKASPNPPTVVLSVSTSSGRGEADKLVGKLIDHAVFCPVDVSLFQLRAAAAIRPAALVVMETELWFNMLFWAKEVGAKVMLVNGRLSPKSTNTYAWVSPYPKACFRLMDRVLMQTQEYADRARFLGARDPEVIGNTKFDAQIEIDPGARESWRTELGIPADAMCVVVGSTRSDEEEALVIGALQAADTGELYVVHAPRHPDTAKGLSDAAARAFSSVGFRSKRDHARYLVLDTFGELSQVYSAADIAIVGGGFGNTGGQNIIEPMAHGKPVLHGANMFNFAEVARLSLTAGATRECVDQAALTLALKELIQDPALREKMGASGRELVQANAGASQKYAEAILAALPTAETLAPTS